MFRLIKNFNKKVYVYKFYNIFKELVRLMILIHSLKTYIQCVMIMKYYSGNRFIV